MTNYEKCVARINAEGAKFFHNYKGSNDINYPEGVSVMPNAFPTLHELRITANKVTFKGTEVPLTLQEISDLFKLAIEVGDAAIALEELNRDTVNLSEL